MRPHIVQPLRINLALPHNAMHVPTRMPAASISMQAGMQVRRTFTYQERVAMLCYLPARPPKPQVGFELRDAPRVASSGTVPALKDHKNRPVVQLSLDVRRNKRACFLACTAHCRSSVCEHTTHLFSEQSCDD
jgi:hypothetical protein